MTGVLMFCALVAADVAADACEVPAAERAPDPRCGETLDGRVPAQPSVARTLGHATLAVPRVATEAVLWPVVTTVDALEYHQAVDWARALLTTDDGLVGVRPELQYSTSFTPTAGLRLFYRRLPRPGSEIMLRARTAGESVIVGQLGVRGPERAGLSLLMTYDRRNDRVFAGIGPHNQLDPAMAGQALARYASDNVGAELRWARRLPLRLAAQAHADVQRRDYRGTGVAGDGPSVTGPFGLPAAECAARDLVAPCVDEAEMPGFNRGLRIVHAGGGLGLDLRDPARDGSGVSVEADATIARGVAGDPSRHAWLAAETVAALGGDDRVVVLRARAAMVERLSSAPVPFEELVIPSGQYDMRGFATGRWRGESGMVGTAEYRWYISAYLDATLFVDVGTVAGPRFSGIVWDRWLPSFGIGLRTYQPQGAYWQARAQDGIQIAYAPEGGFRILLSMASF